MLLTCWSLKGGSGTTVVSAALALLLARSHPTGAVAADLAGDLPAAFGVADPGDPGLSGWLAAGTVVPPDALARLELPVGAGVALLPRGTGALPGDRLGLLAGLLDADTRPVVVDCGVVRPGSAAAAVAGAARHSLLVTRACYLGLRRVATCPVTPTGVVLVTEPGRALGRSDVEGVVGAPVVAEVGLEPGVARAVDAGMLANRLPRGLERALRPLAPVLAA